MQKSIILHGPISRQYGKTVSAQLNDILEKHPEYKLQQMIVLNSTEIFCTLLCVFENNQNNQKNQEDKNHE